MPKEKAKPEAPVAVEKMYEDEINILTATQILGYKSDLQTKMLVRKGKLPAKKNAKGFWKLSRATVEQYATDRKANPRTRAGDGRRAYKVRLTDEEKAKFEAALPEFKLIPVNKPKAAAPEPEAVAA